MDLNRKKPYKAREPEDTIFLVRSILHEKLGILMKEEHYKGEDEFYSCRINIANYSLNELNIGTNGKGMKLEYALASAYGEFMERLQNQLLITHRQIGRKKETGENDNAFTQYLKENDLWLNYSFAPDEKNIIFDKSMTFIREYIKTSNIEELEDIFHNENITLAPFFNVKLKTVEYLPLNLIISHCTSNGMSAGNTPQESIIQGMCEIIERYVIRKIYYENISFPSIPIEYFANSNIYKKIQSIKLKYNWEFQVKDCSCNLGFPAIGVLIIDRENMRYMFHLGVDPSPITALERTLTEIYQGRFTLTLKKIDWEFQNLLLFDENLKDVEMFKTCTAGNGHYPLSLVFDEQSYPFEGFDMTWGHSDYQDLEKLVSLFNNLDAVVYIRDVSFLGFPAYYIYVPGLSEFRGIASNKTVKNIDSLKSIYETSRNLRSCDTDSIRELLDYLTENSHYAFKNLQFYNLHHLWRYHNRNLIMSLLYYTTENYSQSLRHIDLYINGVELTQKENKFFTCLRTLIKFKAEKIDEKYLCSIYDENFLRICRNFLNDRNYLNYLEHSNCYKCDNCKIKKYCRIFDTLGLAKKLEEAYVENTPNQQKLIDIFDFTPSRS